LRNGETTEAIGKYNEPGAPEIAGAFWNLASYNFGDASMGSASGVFSVPSRPAKDSVVQVKGDSINNINTFGDGIKFAASKSTSIYGSSNTVMPESVDMTMGLYLGRPA